MMPPRGSASIGSGLAAAREPRSIRQGESIHVVGAGGAGASAAALCAARSGAVVSGCDPGGPSPYTPPLEAAGIHLEWSHSAAHITGPNPPDRLAVTKALTAVDPDNPELAAARAAAVPVEPWQQVIADAAVGRRLVGVAGTHGKSTTAGWLVHVLAAAGLDPCAFVGALLPAALTGGLPSTARWGQGTAFVVEADEYAGNFDPYRPDLAVLTSAEWDHPDVFADRAAVVDAFVTWLRCAAESGRNPIVVANVGDAGVAEVVERLGKWRGEVLRIELAGGGAEPADAAVAVAKDRYLTGTITGADADGTTLRLDGPALSGPVTAHLKLAGRHNAANALGVAAAALQLGVAPDVVAAGLGSFDGVGRRLERKGEGRGVVVYDDYGHHPTAIRETLAAIRQLEPGRRIWAVYEPLTYHRTAALLAEFASVLATADAVAIADIWASRDPDTTITSAAALAEATERCRPGMTSVAPGSVEETAAWLAGEVRSGDAVLVMGGGKSYRIAELLVRSLAD
jgi:UDP-N-acetylmuramate--alanine ligase